MLNEKMALAAEVGFWGWVFAVIGFIWYSFPTRDSFSKRYALRWGGMALVFFILWIMGMLGA